MDLCMSAKRRPGPRVATQWWEQEGLGFGGIWRDVEGGPGGGADGGGGGDRYGCLVQWGGYCSYHYLRDRA